MGADTAERVPVSGTLMWCGSPVLVCASLTLLGDARPSPVVPLGLKPKTKHVLFAFFLFFCLFYLIFSAKTRKKGRKRWPAAVLPTPPGLLSSPSPWGSSAGAPTTFFSLLIPRGVL